MCIRDRILSLIFFYTPFSWRFPFQAIPSRTADGSSFLQLPNYYADTYVSATAGTKLSVPLITSADINAPHTQVTIQEIYYFMIKDVKEAIEQGLPEQSRTVIHPNLGAAYAFLARVYLQMANYEEALKYADMASFTSLIMKS